MRAKVTLLIIILISATIGVAAPQQLVDSAAMHTNPVGNMPKNIAQIGEVGSYSSIKLDYMSNPHIAYYDADNGDLMYTKYDGWNWNTTIVDSTGNVGEHAALVLDRFDNPHIAYYEVTNQDLKYSHYKAS